MRLDYHFVSKGKLQAIDDKVNQIFKDWPNSSIQRFQLWEMVAALELGIADTIFYHKGTILCHGWNGYDFDFYHDNKPQDPYKAWGGFYRLDAAGAGSQTHKFYVMWAKIEDGTLSTEQECREYFYKITSGCGLYHFGIWEWEDAQDYIWGYVGWKSFRKKEDAETTLDSIRNKWNGKFKRGEVLYCENSGYWHCNIEVSVRKPDDDWNVCRTRIRR